MGLLDYYRQFQGLSDEEINTDLHERAADRRARAITRVDALDLSSTTWHEFPHADVVAAVTYAARRALHRPPDPGARPLRRAVADRHGVATGRVAVGNGADQLLRSLALELLEPGDELVTPWPSYGLYPTLARLSGARAVPVPRFDVDALLGAVTQRTRLLILCNPNDPTGALLERDALQALLAGLPDSVVVVLDEALRDFVDAEPVDATLGLLDHHERLLVVRTFSKVYGLAALRCGYALGGAGSEELLERIAPAGGVNALSQAGALEAVRKCDGLVDARRRLVARERARLVEALAGLPVAVAPSQGNALWITAPGLGPGELRAGLERAKILTAPGAPLGAPDHLRVAVQGPDASDRLLEGLATTLRAPDHDDGSPSPHA